LGAAATDIEGRKTYAGRTEAELRRDDGVGHEHLGFVGINALDVVGVDGGRDIIL
jgi:hypothetical protein